MWKEKEHENFVSVSRVFFPLVSVAYMLHYFFYDLPNGLEPAEHWLRFRAFMVVATLGTGLFYWSRWSDKSLYKIPALVCCWIVCQSQAYVALWHGMESWVFCYLLIVMSVLTLRLSALKSTLFALGAALTQAPILVEAGTPITSIFTGTLVSVVVCVVARIPYATDVRTFLLQNENIATQKRLIELNMEFADRLRSFIPRKIAERLDEAVQKERMSIIEASIEVMSPRKRTVTCLFSDIRGYTRESKDLDEFVSRGVLPEVKACSNAVEDFGGIPRKVGDLIFAYFDEPEIAQNVVSALCAAIQISRSNMDINTTLEGVQIRRYVLISTGDAIVGNLGGLDSSIEITALGPPVNFLSRLDEATKNYNLSSQIHPGDILVCAETHRVLRGLSDQLEWTRIDFGSAEVKIRDFQDVHSIYAIRPSDRNYDVIMNLSVGRAEAIAGGEPDVVA